MDIEFVIRFGEWIRQNEYDAVNIFLLPLVFCFCCNLDRIYSL